MSLDPEKLRELEARVDRSFELPPERQEELDAEAVLETIDLLDQGLLRVAEPRPEGGETGPERWLVRAWVQRAITLYFRVAGMEVMELPPFTFYDKVPLKSDHRARGVRVVPPGTVRYGAFLERGAVVMPAYVNIGAWVGAGSMVDTWATVGSGAQVGRGVHLSGGVGIGGVLEPPGKRPVIVEDGAFIGSRSIVVEGVVVEREAVLAAGTVLTASTRIIDVTGPEEVVYQGRVPERSVVIPGTRPKRFPAGTYQVPCALIIGRRKASTDRKTSLNQVLREFALAV